MKEKRDFHSLGLKEELVNSLALQGITEPTGIQVEAIPLVLQGKNIVAESPTGTGKTLAYVAPLVQGLNKESKDLEVLVLVPSRELAMQVQRVVKELVSDIKVAALIGGASTERQLAALKEKPKLAVGTPGRVLELIQKRKINGQGIRAMVVDEVDKMLTQGFMQDVRSIFKATLKTRQALFFSATVSEELMNHLGDYMAEFEKVEVREKGRTPFSIKHWYFTSSKEQKTQLLCELIRFLKPRRAMVFINRNEGVGPLAGRLQELGIQAAGLHSDLIQLHRKNVLEKFRSGEMPVLVTTDLLARGLDVKEIDYIFNFDLPIDAEHYLHRVGRTGRGGREGTTVALVTEEERFIIEKFNKALGIRIEQMGYDGERVFPIVRRKREALSGKIIRGKSH